MSASKGVLNIEVAIQGMDVSVWDYSRGQAWWWCIHNVVHQNL